MDEASKDWIKYLAIIADNSSYPVLILSSDLDVVYSNEQANSTFQIDSLTFSLENIFENKIVNRLTEFLSPVFHREHRVVLKEFLVETKSGLRKEFDLTAETLEVINEKYLILFFKGSNTIKSDILDSGFNLLTGEAFSIAEKKIVKKFTEQIQPLVPFTVIEKQKLNKIINEENFPIWVKDLKGNLIAVNKIYCQILGLDERIIEGREHLSFLPFNIASIIKTVDDYILRSGQSTSVSLLSKNVNDKNTRRQIIQVPLFDNLNKISAILGLILDIDNPVELNSINEFISRILKSESLPACYIFSNGIIKLANQEFCTFVERNFEEIVNKNIQEVFEIDLSEKIMSFLQNSSTKDNLFDSISLNLQTNKTITANINVIKISGAEESLNSALVFINDSSNKDDNNELYKIILNRGKMFESLIQKNPEPIFIYDKENLRFLEVNEAATNLYGYSRDEFMQMDLTDLYTPEDIQTLLESFNDESSEGKFSKPFRHRKKDGSTVIVEISKTSFKFNDKDAHFNIVKDITSAHELEKQNQILKTIYKESETIVFITDSFGFITSINYPVIEKLGYTTDALIKSSFTSLIVDEDRALVNTSIFQAYIKDSVSLETKIKKADGEFAEAEVSATPVFDYNEEIDSFTIIVKVKSGYTQATKEVVKEIVKEVVVEKIVEAAPSKNLPDTNFLSGMFHEILTPVNVIIGFSQELVGSLENPSSEQKEAAELINQNRIKILDVMNSVAEYSDIIQNKTEFKKEKISITEIIDDLDNNINEITGINDIQFGYGKISSSLSFITDKQKFESLIHSLIKVIARLSRDKKVYFSAYPVSSDSFLIAISDQYSNSSEYVANVLNKIFVESRDPKDYGLPKLTTQLAKILLSILGGKFYSSVPGSLRNESGFLFYTVLDNFSTPIAEAERTVAETKTLVEKATVQPIQQPVHIQEKIVEEKKIEELPEPIEEEQEPVEENKREEFSPVIPIADELLTKIPEPEIEPEPEFLIPEPEVEPEIIPQKAPEPIPVSTPKISEKEVEDVKYIPPVQKIDLTSLSCLYVEDQVDSQILFKVQLKGLKDVKFAVSFEEAQPMLLNYHFDFIVIDINLQGEYNGLEVLKIIKTMPALNNVPIIAVTAYVLPGDKEKFIASGFDDFIPKPIFREKMIESLEKIFLRK